MKNKIKIISGSNGVILRVEGLPKGWTWEEDVEDVCCAVCHFTIYPDDIVDELENGSLVHYDCNDEE